jgi:hypothetical protein
MSVRPDPDEPQAELARMLDALRSPARPSELAGRDERLRTMAEATAEARGIAQMHHLIGRKRVAVAVASGVLAVGGMAAAGAGTFVSDERPTLTSEPPTTDPATTDPATSEPPTTDPATPDPATTEPPTTDPATPDPATTEPPTTGPATPDPATTEPPTTDASVDGDLECADGNHGKTVSSVAHETPPGPDHGEAVSEAARSDCGKSDDDGDDEADDGGADVDDEATADTTDQPGNSGRSPGNGGNGKGDGNGGGNGKGGGKHGG